MKVFPESEITSSSNLIIINGSVIDVSKFMKIHPGGEELIKDVIGTDATTAYKMARHSPKADAIIDRLTVGKAKQSETAMLLTVADVEAKAAEKLTSNALLYYNAGAEGGEAISESKAAWGRYWLIPRVLVNVSNVSTECKLLNNDIIAGPILAAPTALLKMGHPEGEKAVAQGCHSVGLGNCLSTTSSVSMEDVHKSSPECYKWFQLYVYRDKKITLDLMKRAEQNNYSAICLTVDLPVLGNRTSLQKGGFKVPDGIGVRNIKDSAKSTPGDRKAYVSKLYDQNITEELLVWMSSHTKLPIIVKGVLSVESAIRIAKISCVKGIVVSNHGGRQLNSAIPPALALPSISDAVQNCNIARVKNGLVPVQIFADGGIRRGSDIFKALALGATAVLIGRPVIYGMAVGGAEGVQKVLSIFLEELTNCMQLSGAKNLSEITRDMVSLKSNY